MSHIKIESFNTPEELEAWLAEQEKTKAEVQKRPLAPEQEAITFGSHAVRFWDGDLVIFVEVPTLEQQSVIEDAEVIDNVKAKEKQENTLWIKGYSVDCVDGEFGYNHRSVMWPITKETFDAAWAVQWDLTRLLAINGLAHLSVQSAYYDLRGWTLAHAEPKGG